MKNRAVRAFVHHWASHTGAAAVQVVSPADEPRLIEEALAAGEIQEVVDGRYYARSFVKDTARSEERTFVATGNPGDRGIYNNWVPSDQIRPKVEALMKGASAGKVMYVIPYLMANPGSPLAKWAVGLELTDNRLVVLHMLRMTRVGPEYLDAIEGDVFVRGVHVTGDLDQLNHGTPEDTRHFVTFADERLILHFGSSYGGNALLGKIAHGLRQASYDGYASGEFLAEQFMLIGIHDKETGRTHYIAGGFPSASGKTNLAMLVPPRALAGRYEATFLGDDITWLYVDPADGRLYGFNPEFGVFGVAKDTNEITNPNAMKAVGPGSGSLLTNVAYNEVTKQVWWEGLTPKAPRDVAGWRDWKGELISDRPPELQAGGPGHEWSHPNSRFTARLANVPNLSEEWRNPRGVPIDAIIFGGRVHDREPLIRALPDLTTGVYDGLTLGTEATAAAEGKAGVIRYDPMSMRPFMSYAEGPYARHWLDLIGRCRKPPVFAHVNWFQRDNGRYIWPGYAENLRPLLWLLDLAEGRVKGVDTPVGVLPAAEELNLDGLSLAPSDLERLLSCDPALWREEAARRERHLAQFEKLPEEIWQAHRDLVAALTREAKAP